MLVYYVLLICCVFVIFVIVKLPNGTVVAESHNPAVPQYILNEIYSWMEQGACMEDVVERLRPRTVPCGYAFHNWRTGINNNMYF